MASVRLEPYNGRVRDLPPVCMKCGAPSTRNKDKTFSWYPPWVGVLLLAGLIPFVIVAVIMTKRCRVEAPLCDQHKNHWLMRQLLVLLSLVGMIGAGAVFGIIVGAVSDRGPGDDLFGLMCMGWLGLLLVWIILAVVVQSTTIRPNEITDTSIRLTSVAAEFAQACEEELPQARTRLDRAARERWNQDERRPRRSEVRPAEEFESDEDDGRRRTPPDTYREGPS